MILITKGGRNMKYPEIANRFEYIMNLRHLKQVDLVNKTGISKSSINQYVRGTHCPENDRAMLLADVLRVNPLWLMGFDVPMEGDKNIMDSNKPNNEREANFVQLYSQLSPAQQTLIDNMLTALIEKQEVHPASQETIS